MVSSEILNGFYATRDFKPEQEIIETLTQLLRGKILLHYDI